MIARLLNFTLLAVLLTTAGGCLYFEPDPPEGNLVDNTPKETLTAVELKNWIIMRLAADSLMQPEEEFAIYPVCSDKRRLFLAGIIADASRTSGKIRLSVPEKARYRLILQDNGKDKVSVSFRKGNELMWKNSFHVSNVK